MVATVLARRELDLTSGGYFRTRLTDEYFNCNAIRQHGSHAEVAARGTRYRNTAICCPLSRPVRFRGSARHPPPLRRSISPAC
jgi:hypothetical protein